MKKGKFLYILIILLVLLNVVSMFFLISGPRVFHPNDQKLKKHLQFTDEQMNQFVDLKDKHRNHINQLTEQLSTLNHQYFTKIITAEPSKDSIILNSILSLTSEMYHENYDHLIDIKNICNEDQLDKFEEFLDQHLKIFINKESDPHTSRVPK